MRSIVGLSLKAANETFSDFLNNTGLGSRQMHFVKQIIHYIFQNGMMKDLTVLQESPFSDLGNISEIFDDVKVFMDLRTAIERITGNASA